ncbi:MAG: PDZ domain-containing protein [Planctomycetota bacterium]
MLKLTLPILIVVISAGAAWGQGARFGPACINTENGKGVLVERVPADSPAARIGIEAGDVIVKLGEVEITNIDVYSAAFDTLKPGDRVVVAFRKAGTEGELKQETVILERVSAPPAPISAGRVKANAEEMAARIRANNAELQKNLRESIAKTQREVGEAKRNARLGFLGVITEERNKSVYVVEVVPMSSAEKIGIKVGDRIVKIENRDVKDRESFRGAIQSKGPGNILNLEVERENRILTLTPELGETQQDMDFGLAENMITKIARPEAPVPGVIVNSGTREQFAAAEVVKLQKEVANLREEIAQLREELKSLQSIVQRERDERQRKK